MSKEKLYTLIKSPIITEQTAQLGESLKQVVFKVDISANKEIKKAVEKLFNVEVIKVTTSIVKGKTKRNRFGFYKKSDYKKAFVSISDESEIQFEGINQWLLLNQNQLVQVEEDFISIKSDLYKGKPP